MCIRDRDDTAHAQALFDMLRRFDTLCPARILAQCPDERGVGLAVVNRLKKAAGFTVIPAPDIRVIGLTGRSGSGKSTAARDVYKRQLQRRDDRF